MRLVDFCKRYNVKRTDANKAIARLGIYKMKEKSKGPRPFICISDESVRLLAEELSLPMELIPFEVMAKGLRAARNPRYIICAIDGEKNAMPVLIPKKYKQERFIKKRFKVEKIEDSKGVSYRHPYFSRLESLR